MLYKCRTTKPTESKWYEVEASSPELAANEFHNERILSVKSLVHVMEDSSGRYLVKFVLVEVEGHGERVSRIFEYGIWRKGGVKTDYRTPEQKLKELADALGYTKPPETGGGRLAASVERSR